MIDNLQRFYLQRLEVAAECALHDNIDGCVNLCLELLQKTDLALWTRALVNLTLADSTPIEYHPDKSRFAAEALRLVNELQQEDHPGKNAFWIAEYDKVQKHAEDSLAKAKQEEQEYQEHRESLRQSKALSDIEDDLQGLELENQGGMQDIARTDDDNDDGSNLKWELIEDSEEEDEPIVEQPLGAEGRFTFNPAQAGEEAEPATEDKAMEEAMEEEDVLGGLPIIKAVGKKSSQKGAKSLPTPPPSSPPRPSE
ncbi:hypothetical protein LTR10_024289 [Elasticomyces elasticus]|uniref:Uncharacterized protein n=1 Tax=Exophiala sideris TaxID=1016849 RepID=A0ABR0J9R5_9EURO|nr:hypothetical protein LTR10_024289 [Elasticomyces elasticus]KAK5025539.1 hypothetical protein LTR13_010378 [Exophiala sideris]KAK5029811.1 hypothetical protein LTS07_005535 [Exophiala sideris]KAK5058427.1 hypothetical protein LTR69_006832 [Exophiala sideris]KAK5178600.1 hypothetical protein LTR44_008971 [Eurotiomycetes sp. CCFEE 6388]